MNLRNVSLAHRRNLICPESCFATVASIFKRNYEMMFCKAWDFTFNENDPALGPTIGNRISPGEWNRRTYLEQYHGICVNQLHAGNSAEVIEAARHELEVGLPVVILYDSYFSPWAREADKQDRFMTMFLLLGLEHDGVYCIDAHLTKSMGYIPMELFLQGCSPHYTTFSITHDEVTDLDWRDIVKPVTDKFLEKGTSGNAFDAMRRLADYFSRNFNFGLELRGGVNLVGYPLLYANLLDLGRGRGRFASILKYLAKLDKAEADARGLIEQANRLFYAESQWNLISGELMKAYQKGDFDNNKIGAKFSSGLKIIADFEEQIAGALQKLYRGETLVNNYIPFTGENACCHGEAEEIVSLNLKNYLNNKGFGNLDTEDEAGDLTGTGEFYLTEALPQNHFWQVAAEPGGMNFSFPVTGKGTCDNISCQNQVIDAPLDNYSSIMLLGCAEFGVYYIPLVIVYEDGVKEEVMAEFIDWGNKDLPKITEDARPIVAWEGLGIDKNQTGQNKKPGYLYAHRHYLKHDSKVRSILLPDCPNVHLFAISLGKVNDLIHRT